MRIHNPANWFYREFPQIFNKNNALLPLSLKVVTNRQHLLNKQLPAEMSQSIYSKLLPRQGKEIVGLVAAGEVWLDSAQDLVLLPEQALQLEMRLQLRPWAIWTFSEIILNSSNSVRLFNNSHKCLRLSYNKSPPAILSLHNSLLKTQSSSCSF